MLKAYKYRLFPNRSQRKLLQEQLEECRWLYNHFLEERKVLWEREKKSHTYYSQAVSIPKLKQNRESLSTVYSQILQNVAVRVDLAFQAFFLRIKRGEKPGYPRFKGGERYDSITYPQTGFGFENGKLKLSKIGFIKIKLHRPISGKIKTCTVRRRVDKWYACFSVEVGSKPLRKSNKAIGVDVGLESFATFSDGKKVANPRFFRTDQKALAKAQRILSKQKKSTSARRKTKKVVNRIHERIKNRRNNFCHQISRKLVNRYGVICIEDMEINKMMADNFRVINRSIGDVAWGQFAHFLSYKAEEAGRKLIRVNPAYTSQTCSRCGYRQVKKLSDRVHCCSNCGLQLDRDHNAAINILALGMQSIGV